MDFVAKRYGQLPSQVIREGEHFDQIVAEVAQGYENYLHTKAENDKKGVPTMGKKYSTKDLQSMMDRVKNGNQKN